MSIRSLKNSKLLREHGKRLKRAGLSERVFVLVDEFNNNRSYKNAMVLAGRLRAIALAAKFDYYWDEKASTGFEFEIENLAVISEITATLPEGKESWWIK